MKYIKFDRIRAISYAITRFFDHAAVNFLPQMFIRFLCKRQFDFMIDTDRLGTERFSFGFIRKAIFLIRFSNADHRFLIQISLLHPGMVILLQMLRNPAD